jgi:3-phenylpropionate/trans-cinnamate dioxygenase ferredoxin subunit
LSTNGFVSCLKERELEDGKMRAVHVKGKPILLAKVAGQVFGVSNLCLHMGCEFQGGILTGYVLMCPCHGWKFDVRNGQYQENPQTALTSYRCKIQKGKIYVEIQK